MGAVYMGAIYIRYVNKIPTFDVPQVGDGLGVVVLVLFGCFVCVVALLVFQLEKGGL